MRQERNSNKSSKKVPIIIAIISVLIVAVIAVGIFMSKDKPGENNDDVDIEGTTKAKIELKLEYGDEIEDKSFTVNTGKSTIDIESGKREVNYVDLDPEVDAMKVGKTEHNLVLEAFEFKVTVIVEDTKKPVIKGVKDVIKLKGEKVNVEEELTKLITAEDPIDGKVEVIFEIDENEKKANKYNVIASATDKNDNKVTRKFEVIVSDD